MPKRIRCEVYSRVVGFLTPTSRWNVAKRQEWKDRRTYDFQEAVEEVQQDDAKGTVGSSTEEPA